MFFDQGYVMMADSLYRTFYENINYHWQDYTDFVEDYFRFLIETEKYDAAKEMYALSLGFDLRHLIHLFNAKGQLGRLESELVEFDLTRSQTDRLLKWRDLVLAGGRVPDQ